MKKAKKITAIILALIMSLGCFSLVCSAEESENSDHLTEVPEGYVGIYTKEDLLKVHYDATAKYILMNDICFNYSDFDEDYNDGNGWIPFPQFSGVFDGNNYKISNLRISGNIDNAGLFSSITSSSIVKNLFVENINIDVTGNKVGGITGSIVLDTEKSNYIISNCMVSGNVSGGKYVSGICGYAYVSSNDSMFILTNCCNAASVNGISSVGGVLGFHGGGASYEGYIGSRGSYAYIYKCVNTGNICAEGNAGGLVGYTNEGYASGTYGGPGYGRIDINQSFNCGDVTASKQCGGIIGGLSAIENYQITISNCYNVGIITSSTGEGFGAIIGINKGNINNTYYVNKSVIDPTTLVGTSLTADQLKLKNMGNDWTLEGREDYPYPELVGVPLLFPDDITHIHDYSSSVTKEATHLEEGVETFICSCGHTYTEVIDKLTNHNYEAVITLPTCTGRGYTTYTCECGDTYDDNYVDATGHHHKPEITIPATHLEEGLMTFICACGDTYTGKIEKLEKHNYETVITAPTCTEQGYTTYTCECGDSYIDDYVNAIGHSHTPEITTPATHTTTGIMTYTCACGDTYTEVISKLEKHNYETIITAPTCTERGYTTYTCECGDTYVDDYVDELGHTPANAVEENHVAPTCTEDGSKDVVVYCSVCDKELSRETETIEATGHTDNDGDGYCDADNELLDPSVECECNCHKDGITNFFFKLILFFQRLFGSNKECSCGVIHY